METKPYHSSMPKRSDKYERTTHRSTYNDNMTVRSNQEARDYATRKTAYVIPGKSQQTINFRINIEQIENEEKMINLNQKKESGFISNTTSNDSY